jgi:hypothetical protein
MAAPTVLGDFGEIVGTIIEGKSPLIVGGHAVNAWAMYFLPRITSELLQFQPFTSKDLDLLGTRSLLDALHSRFGGLLEVSPPRTPVVGRIVVKMHGREFKIEVLHAIRGLPDTADSEAILLDIEGIRVRVPRPPQLLQSKLANAATLDQADRQDVRHVRILILCTREFLADALSAAQSGMISERAAINALEEVRTILLSREASRASKSSMLELRDCWPVQALERSSLPKVDRFWRNRLAPML